MGYDMSIAAMSIDMHQQLTSEKMGVAVMKMAMEMQETTMDDMLEAIDVSDLTGVGGNLDIYA